MADPEPIDPFFGGLVGGAFDLAGGLLGAKAERKAANKADRYNQQQAAATFELLRRAQSRDALFGGLQRSALLAGQKGEKAGFSGARKALELGGTVARAGVEQRGRQNQAATEQSVVSRGLLGTSTGAQAFSGVGDQTSSQLAAIDAQQAQAFADLGLAEGALAGQHGQQLAGLEGQNRAIQAQFGQALAEYAPRTGKLETEQLRNELYGVPLSAPQSNIASFLTSAQNRRANRGGEAAQALRDRYASIFA